MGCWVEFLMLLSWLERNVFMFKSGDAETNDDVITEKRTSTRVKPIKVLSDFIVFIDGFNPPISVYFVL